MGCDPLMVFGREWGDGKGEQPIELSRAEYEAVRATSNRLAIALNHENPESEVVVSESERYAVVDKIEGVAMRIARDATLSIPALMLPSIQVNIRAGHLPPPAANGLRYLLLPLNRF